MAFAICPQTTDSTVGPRRVVRLYVPEISDQKLDELLFIVGKQLRTVRRTLEQGSTLPLMHVKRDLTVGFLGEAQGLTDVMEEGGPTQMGDPKCLSHHLLGVPPKVLVAAASAAEAHHCVNLREQLR
jgi:hypothetical protein